LGAARFFGRKRQPVLVRQGVDAGGFTGVGAAHKGDFWHVQRWQKLQLRGGGQKLGGVHPAHGNFLGFSPFGGRVRCGGLGRQRGRHSPY
jgi:hypothetical protein